jgi:hypothetical protein
MQKLNKVATMMLMGMVIFSMTSCKKDGVYNPKKKISKIYTQQGAEPKKLSETWTWDKNKVVSMVDEAGAITYFEYDKNRISKITNVGGYSEYTYDGSKLSKITSYVGSVVYATITFEHDGKKISKVTMETISLLDFDLASTTKSLMSRAMRFVLPVQVSEAIASSTQKSRKAGGIRMSYTLKWKGDNVEEVSSEEISLLDMTVVEKMTISYTYDTKKNPYDGLLLMDAGATLLSKNNILSEHMSIDGVEAAKTDYTFTYDSNFPTEEKAVTIYAAYPTVKGTSTTYYEYK